MFKFKSGDYVVSRRNNVFYIVRCLNRYLGTRRRGYRVKNLISGCAYDILAVDAHNRWTKAKPNTIAATKVLYVQVTT